MEIHLNVQLAGETNPKSFTVEIYSSLGNKVYSSQYSEQIPLTAINDGMYFVKIQSANENKYVTKKLIIRR